MKVRAKFKVTGKISHMANVQGDDGTYAEKEVGTVKLSAVYGDANKEWSVWTPSGEISMTINNPPVYASFQLGAEYFIDFTPAAE